MPKFLDLTDKTFGRLTVTGPAIRRAGRVHWQCRCECGSTPVVFVGSLRAGRTESCGCLRAETTAARNHAHGGTSLPEYRVWLSMRTRCTNSAEPSYPRYGGRGIQVCERWESFENFLADMGSRPTRHHQIERTDNDGNYEPGNCRWATRSENCNNRVSSRVLVHDGRTLTLAEWARETGLNSHTVANRIDRLGWSVQRALTTPPRYDPRYH